MSLLTFMWYIFDAYLGVIVMHRTFFKQFFYVGYLRPLFQYHTCYHYCSIETWEKAVTQEKSENPCVIFGGIFTMLQLYHVFAFLQLKLFLAWKKPNSCSFLLKFLLIILLKFKNLSFYKLHCLTYFFILWIRWHVWMSEQVLKRLLKEC